MRATRRTAQLALLAVALLGCCSCAGRAMPFAAGGASGQLPASSPEPAVSGAAVPTPVVNATVALPSRKKSPARPLTGQIIGIDPGHDGGNFNDPTFISRLVWNGVAYETCDTTGTETTDGYTEAQFNFNVASDLRADLTRDGARVVMTRTTNDGVGPCVTRRAHIINLAHADVAISIHADGGPSWGRGFTVLEPVADGPNDKVIAASASFGADVKAALLKYTTMPTSDYYGNEGIIQRDNLAGLNLTTVPKVLVECGNMPNATDAALLTTPAFQRKLARALTAAIIRYLTS